MLLFFKAIVMQKMEIKCQKEKLKSININPLLLRGK
jgi:hypothetical protein